MLKPLSEKVLNLKPSPTILLDTEVKKRISNQETIINMIVGETIESTPSSICQTAIEAIQKNKTKYGATSGLAQLKTGISQQLKSEFNLHYQDTQIVVSAGVKQSISQAFISLLNRNDEVIIPAPYWVTYPDLVSLCEAKPVIIRTKFENYFKLTAQELESSITSKTKLVVLNSPNNPSGAVYTHDELNALAQVIVKHNLYCLSDEIYHKIIYDKQTYTSMAQCLQMQERTILVDGFSKAYAMTGWRLGYSVSPPHIAQKIADLQSQMTHHPSMISQYGGIAALKEQKFVKQLKNSLEEKRNIVLNFLQNISDVSFQIPVGAFYFWLNIESFLKSSHSISNSQELSRYLLQKFSVAVMPGSAFGVEGMIRLSFTLDKGLLKQGLKLLQQGLTSLK